MSKVQSNVSPKVPHRFWLLLLFLVLLFLLLSQFPAPNPWFGVTFGTFMTWCHAAFSLRHTFAVFVRATQEVIKDSTGFRVFHFNFGRDFTGSDAVSPNDVSRFTFGSWELGFGCQGLCPWLCIPKCMDFLGTNLYQKVSIRKPLHCSSRLLEGVLLNILNYKILRKSWIYAPEISLSLPVRY